MSVQPLPSPAYYPSATLTKPKDFPGVFLLELHARPDNRLSNEFILQTVSLIRERRATADGGEVVTAAAGVDRCREGVSRV